ncbi:hypothetical protein BSKO_08029 [Bryopsis sp. KO-2023]|nr:hypothetical protein BSKO_08029 [Bryopsis sp. KO-2023]
MAAKRCTLSLDDGAGSAGILLLLSHLNLPTEKCKVKASEGKLELVAADGVVLTGKNTISKYLASISQKSSDLLGKTPEEAAEVSQWMNHVYTNLNPLVDEKLAELNKRLEDRVFLVGGYLTLADLAVFSAVHPAVSAFPVAQTGHFCNLIRWCDFIGRSEDASEKVFSRVAFPSTRFDFTPPAMPATSSPAKAASPENGKTGKVGEAKANSSPAPNPTTQTPASSNNAAAPPDQPEGAQASKKDKKKEKKEKKPKEPAKKKVVEVKIDMLDLRVGKIIKVERHPDADSLYLEQIDLGEEKPRQVISGLVKFVPVEKMQDRMVIVCCNLKPANMRGILSSGMVLCASDEKHESCDPLIPPEGVSIGEKITFAGYADPPAEEIKPKQKVLEKLFPDLVTDAQGVAKYKDSAFETSKGVVSSTIPNGLVR